MLLREKARCATVQETEEIQTRCGRFTLEEPRFLAGAMEVAKYALGLAGGFSRCITFSVGKNSEIPGTDKSRVALNQEGRRGGVGHHDHGHHEMRKVFRHL